METSTCGRGARLGTTVKQWSPETMKTSTYGRGGTAEDSRGTMGQPRNKEDVDLRSWGTVGDNRGTMGTAEKQ